MKTIFPISSLIAVCLLASQPSSSGGDVLIESFDGGSGGVPAGWTQSEDNRTGTGVVEQSGAVEVTDVRISGNGNGPVIISSPSFNPFPAGTTSATLEVDIASMSGNTSSPVAVIVIGNTTIGIIVTLDDNADEIEISAIEFSGGPNLTPAAGSPFAYSYAGGTVTFVVTFDSNSFRATSTTNSFDSGDILFTSFGIAGFDSASDFGPSAQVSLGSDASDADGSATVIFDAADYRTDDTPLPTDPNAAQKRKLKKQLKKLTRQLKSAKRSGSRSKVRRIKRQIRSVKRKLRAL